MSVEGSWSIERVSDHGSQGHGFESLGRRDWTLCLSQTTQMALILVDKFTQEAVIKSDLDKL